MAPTSLPGSLYFQSVVDGRYVRLHPVDKDDFLEVGGIDEDPAAVQEPTELQVAGRDDVFMIKNKKNSKYWERKQAKSNYIMAERDVTPTADDKDCLFQVVPVPVPVPVPVDNTVALQCLGNSLYLTRTVTDYLAATSHDYSDPNTHFTVIEAKDVVGVDFENSSEDGVLEAIQVLDNRAMER